MLGEIQSADDGIYSAMVAIDELGKKLKCRWVPHPLLIQQGLQLLL